MNILSKKIINEKFVIASTRTMIKWHYLTGICNSGSELKTIDCFTKLFKDEQKIFAEIIWDNAIKALGSEMYTSLNTSEIDHPFKCPITAYYAIKQYKNNIRAEYFTYNNGDLILTIEITLTYNDIYNRIEIKPIYTR